MNDLKFAIKMENDGEKYYRQQAEINENKSVRTVCLMMAEDEKKHAQILIDKMNEKPYQLIDTGTLSKAKNVFEGKGDIKVEGKATPSQLDFYRTALDMEKQSIDLYAGYLSKADGAEEKELFEYLIQMEKQHFDLINELVTMLGHAEQWVEFAEFGVRKEY
jgi:rubrerythrin